MTNLTKPKTGIQADRIINFEIRSVKAEERRVTVSFSSEQPVNRWYGLEILQHDNGNVNLDRLNNIGVALFNHDRSYVIGKVENAELAADEKRTYADIVFDRDPEADLIFQKVQSGTLKGVSVGYAVDVWEEVDIGKASGNGRFTGPAYIATKWTPYEISIVSVPADDSVGVGRDLEDEVPAGGSLLDKYERQIQRNQAFFNLYSKGSNLLDKYERQVQMNMNSL
jgi:HK97 family phage prohead protease